MVLSVGGASRGGACHAPNFVEFSASGHGLSLSFYNYADFPGIERPRALSVFF
ncbi:hypothetical protein GCM10008986_10230 [Salinibacillus aidingensis]|uniref:Uncharacterized protein n=1 Tax=Salinibacillus aidingensis TaxID=237684 RepID=A0ABN1AYW3_9BACI